MINMNRQYTSRVCLNNGISHMDALFCYTARVNDWCTEK